MLTKHAAHNPAAHASAVAARRWRRSLSESTALAGTLALVPAVALGIVISSAGPAAANPEGGTVAAGSASIEQTSDTRLDVNQHSDKVIIDWRSFSIAGGEHTNFNQPGATSIALNRVTGGSISEIMGKLTANGQIMLINPNGIVFGSGAQIDVGGLVATTSDISNDRFMAGDFTFDQPGNADATVVNHGDISVSERGLAAFVAPGVENAGVINARLGQVTLASGNKFTVDMYGDGLVHLAVDDKVAAGALGVGKGQIENAGTIQADGGIVLLTASAAEGVVNNVINMDGLVQANTVEQTADGRIILGGGEGTVSVTGTLEAKGDDAGESGGTVEVTGEQVALSAGARIDVSGEAGGGEAYVGIDASGSKKAKTATLDASVEIDASADSGDGGFFEISGDSVALGGAKIDVGSAQGKGGRILLDPVDHVIDAAEVASIVAGLESGDFDIAAENSITVDAEIDTSGQGNSHMLSFLDENSDNDLTVNLNALVTLASTQSLAGEATEVNVNTVDRRGIDNAFDLLLADDSVAKAVQLADGTWDLGGSTLGVDQANTTLRGTSRAGTILDASAINGYGIQVAANDVALETMTVLGPSANIPSAYGIKVAPPGGDPANSLTGISLADLTVQGSGRSEIDFNGVDNSSITNVTADGQNTSGVGIALTDSNDITLTDITTTGNNWGGVALFAAGNFFEGGTSGVTLAGTNSLGEANPLYAQESNGESVTDVTLPSTWQHVVRNDTFRPDATEFTFFQRGEQDAINFALLALGAPDDSTVATLSRDGSGFVQVDNTFVVGQGTDAAAGQAMSVGAAVGAAASGGTINVGSGDFVQSSQVVIDKDLALIGTGATKGVITPGGDFTGDAAGDAWFLVDAGVDFGLSDLVLDGDGHFVWQALRSHGNTTVDNVDFRDFRGSASGSPYRGVAIQSYGGTVGGGAGSDSHGSGGAASHLVVTGSTFEQIGRIGVLVKGTEGTADIAGNTYTGKGTGDHLDYGMEVSAGAQATITGNSVSGNRGVAASDGSTSAGILVTTFFGDGTEATIENNIIDDSHAAVAVGFDANDTSVVTARDNDLSGNNHGVVLTSADATADFSANWWGFTGDGDIAGYMDGAEAGSVDFTPFLMSGTDTEPGTVGFQGDFSDLTVTALGEQTGGIGRIQEGVDSVIGSTVNVGAGTFEEQVVIGKDLTLTGAGADQTTITSVASPDSFKIDESGSTWQPIVFAYGGTSDGASTPTISGSETVVVNISDLTIDGDDRSPGGGIRSSGILFRNVEGSIEDNVVRNMHVGSQETFGILAYGASDVVIARNDVSGYSRAGIGANGNFGASPSPHAIITDNTVTGPGKNVPVTWAPNGIQIGWGATGEITGNEVSANGWPGPEWSGSGIILAGVSDVLIAGNDVLGNETGISLVGDLWFGSGMRTEDTVIENNVFADNTWGISIQDSTDGTEILSNELHDNETAISVAHFGLGDAPDGTVIDGNEFTANSVQLSDSAEVLDIASVLNDNTFDRAVTVDRPGNSLLSTIWSLIQDGVDAAVGGDTVNVADGNYREQVVIDKDLTLTGAGVGSTVIEAPDTLVHSFSSGGKDRRAIVSVESGADADISGLTVDGRGQGAGNRDFIGIGMHNASGTVNDVRITRVREGGPAGTLNGNQHGVGMAVYNDDGTDRTVTLSSSSIDDFQKNATAFIGPDLTANVLDNVITGAGATDVIGQNGIQFSSATGDIAGNEINGIAYTGSGWASSDILLSQAHGTQVLNNTVNGLGGSGAGGAGEVHLYSLFSDDVLVQGNSFDNNLIGVLAYGGDNMRVVGNDISNAVAGGVGVYAFTSTNTTIEENAITGNDIGVYVEGSSVASAAVNRNEISGSATSHVVAGGSDILDASNNWWGTTDTASIASMLSGEVDFSPILLNGDTDGGAVGFGADMSELTVHQDGAQTAGLIQEGVDSVVGSTVNIAAGTYTENVTIDKGVTVSGDAAGGTTVQAGSGAVFTIEGDGFGSGATVRIEDLDLANSGSGRYGVRVLDSTRLDTLEVASSTITGFDENGIAVFGDTANAGISVEHLSFTDLALADNGGSGSGGRGGINVFHYNGNAALTDVTVTDSGTGARHGIQFRGVGDGDGTGVIPMGEVSLDNVAVTGKYEVGLLRFQRYSDVSTLSLEDVTLGGPGSDITGSWGSALRFDGVGEVGAGRTVDLGNTSFAGLDSFPTYIEFAPDNTFAFLEADATGTTWEGVAAADMTLDQLFDAEDRINHALDPDNPTHGPWQGLARLRADNLFVTNASGSINRGIEFASAGDTINVQAGTYGETVLIDKPLGFDFRQTGATPSGVTVDGLGTSAGGTVDMTGTLTGTGGDFTFDDPLGLTGTLSLDLAGADLTFNDDVNGAGQALFVFNPADVDNNGTMTVGSYTQPGGTGVTDFGPASLIASGAVTVESDLGILGSITGGPVALFAPGGSINTAVSVISLNIRSDDASITGSVANQTGETAAAATSFLGSTAGFAGPWLVNGFDIFVARNQQQIDIDNNAGNANSQTNNAPFNQTNTGNFGSGKFSGPSLAAFQAGSSGPFTFNVFQQAYSLGFGNIAPAAGGEEGGDTSEFFMSDFWTWFFAGGSDDTTE